MNNLLFTTAAVAVLAAFLLQDCKDLGSQSPAAVTPGNTGVSFRTAVFPLFTQYGCNNCHNSGTYNWYGTDSVTYSQLVNVPAQAGCTTKVRVLPGNASESVLYLRLSGFNCGDRMPKGGNAIASMDLQLVTDWINQGAKNN